MNEDILKHEMNCKAWLRLEFTILDSKIDGYNIQKTKEIAEIDKRLSLFIQSNTRMQEDINEIKETLNNFIKSADAIYARKTTTDTMTKFLWTFGVAIIFWMGSFIWSLITNIIVWK